MAPEPREQAAIAKIRHLRDRRRTLRAIAADLNATGWRTRRGTAWRLEHVARILGPLSQAKRVPFTSHEAEARVESGLGFR